MAFKNYNCLLFIFLIFFKEIKTNEVSKGISNFSKEFYLQTIKEGNVVVSPYSVSNSLILLIQGAYGESFDEMTQAVHLNFEHENVAHEFLKYSRDFNKKLDFVTFETINKIYVHKHYNLNNRFKQIAISIFKCEIENINLDDKQFVQRINKYIEEKTNEKIKNLIKPNQINHNTLLFLLNAIYFKSLWENQFDANRNFKHYFYNNGVEKVLIDYMSQTNEFNFATINELDAKALELKYENSTISFIIVLPNALDGLSTLKNKLKTFDLVKIDDLFQYDSFDIFIPKFKIEFETELNEILKNMGIKSIFTNNANLTGLIDSDENLKISNIIHKVYIEVNESGTEAAATTSSDMEFRMLSSRFEVDHPFMFYIREKTTNTILFIGHVEKF